MAQDMLELLGQAFPTISGDDRVELARLARQCCYPPQTILCHEGQREHIFYLIAEGGAVITKRFNEREERVLRHVGPGDYVGEMAIISDAPRSATVTTTQDTTVLEIDRETFLRILSRNAEFALSIVRLTFDRLRANDRKAIDELRTAFETLEKLDRAKLDFIEVTAHELRTPLTVMRGYASMILGDSAVQNSATLREMVEGIISGSQRLHEIVNNMLDVQRIDMDQLAVASVPVSLPSVLRGLDSDFRESLRARRITLDMDLSRAGDVAFIEADPALISKALSHVLMNAIKYTPDGGAVRVRLFYEEDPKIGLAAHLQVADTGIGIDPAYHDLIFEKFYRLGDVALHSSGKTAYKAGGPGLGLAIARGAILAHGGRLWVESPGHDEGRMPGSTFHVLLPVRAAKQATRDTLARRSTGL